MGIGPALRGQRSVHIRLVSNVSKESRRNDPRAGTVRFIFAFKHSSVHIDIDTYLFGLVLGTRRKLGLAFPRLADDPALRLIVPSEL